MANGSINIRLRPIKLAFLVHPNDRDGLLKVIEINTFLWGGQYNPIIPTFRKRPQVWDDETIKGVNPGKILTGYLENYDPDFVVPVGTCCDMSFDPGNRQIIEVKEILSEINRDRSPKYGIGLFEILQYFIGKELKFIRRKPIDVCFPDFREPYKPFMAALFGILPKNIDNILRNKFDAILETKRPHSSVSNYDQILNSDALFLRRVSSLYVEPSLGSSWNDGCLFFLDAGKILDVIDYWNLRALGWYVLPIPKQAANCERVKQLAVDFIENNFYPINPSVYNSTTILKSRYTTKDELRDFVTSLKIEPPKDKEQWKYLNQYSYPRIWDEWAKEQDHAICCQLEGGTADHNIASSEDWYSLETVDPKFAKPYSRHSEPRFANEVSFRIYGTEKDIIAQVIPEGDERLARAFGGFVGLSHWRFSKKGIVYLSNYIKSSFLLALPKSEELLSEWLRTKGWDVELSAPGRIAKQMLKQLGGIWGISKLADENVISLLEELGEAKVLEWNAFWGKISQIANRAKYAPAPNEVLKRLMKADMFRLGMEIQCPTCTQRSWYSITDFDYVLRCLKCSESFQIPSSSPAEMKWAYRASGPFSLPRRAYGVYAVLLTLRFFTDPHLNSTTPIMSFVAKKDQKKIEADLAIFLQQTKFGLNKTHLVFAECKTYKHFGKEDVDRMKLLGAEFPGAVLVFATLRTSLTEKEKRLLRPFVNQGRRFWKAEHPFNPILILTGTELFSSREPPYCWENLEGKHKAFADAHYAFGDTITLCDVSQQLYLDMKSRFQWLQERWARRRQKELIKNQAEKKKKTGSSFGPSVMRRVPIDSFL